MATSKSLTIYEWAQKAGIKTSEVEERIAKGLICIKFRQPAPIAGFSDRVVDFIDSSIFPPEAVLTAASEEQIKMGRKAEYVLTAGEVANNEDIFTGYFRISGGRTIYSSCTYCNGATGRRVRLDRIEGTDKGLKQYIRDVKPETVVEVWPDASTLGTSYQYAINDITERFSR